MVRENATGGSESCGRERVRLIIKENEKEREKECNERKRGKEYNRREQKGKREHNMKENSAPSDILRGPPT